MSKPFDYSKWDNIELSDDEDDVHPNIDRESWFRMKHRSRVEREEKEEMDKKKIRKEMDETKLRMEEITRTLRSLETSEDSDDELEDKEGLEAELKSLIQENAARQETLDAYEKHKKWNVDNMCKVVEERTIVNPSAAKDKFSKDGYALPTDQTTNTSTSKSTSNTSSTTTPATSSATKSSSSTTVTTNISNSPPSNGVPNTSPPPSTTTTTTTPKTTKPSKPQAGPDRASITMLSYHEFTEQYSDLMEEFMTLSSLDKSRDFLIQHGNIMLQENASNYLLLASLEDEMNGYREKMKLTCRQSQIISNIVELAKTLQSHPGNVIAPFFKRLEEKEHLQGFNAGVDAFIGNVIKRAIVKKKEMDEQRRLSGNDDDDDENVVDLKDVPKEQRLGPGGLDPVEVFESLPVSMQEAFESRDTEMLKKALLEMTPAEAEMHMKRCVDSGLWNEG